MTFVLSLYGGLTALISPALPFYLKRRVKAGKEDETRLQERMGFAARRRPSGPLIWFHGASIGESQVALTLFEAIRAEAPEINGLITTQTMTSAELIARKNMPGLIHQMAPLDSPFAVERFLKHWQPDLAIFAESDIWPNLLTKLDKKRVPRLLVNARMTEKSFDGWMRVPKLAEKLFGRFQAIHAANQKTTDWLKRFAGKKAKYTGNIKHAAPPLSVDEADLKRMQSCVAGRPVLAAISTHPGDEEIVLEAFQLIKKSLDTEPLLILVPRHPERGDEIRDLIANEHVYRRTTETGDPRKDANIWICDTLGEVGLWMRLADSVYLGGGLPGSGIYGHNPIEALKLDRHVLSYPEVDNFRQEYKDLVAAGAAEFVNSAENIAEKALPILAKNTTPEFHQATLRPYLSGEAPLIAARDLALKTMLKRSVS